MKLYTFKIGQAGVYPVTGLGPDVIESFYHTTSFTVWKISRPGGGSFGGLRIKTI